jgi:hypothetical protein
MFVYGPDTTHVEPATWDANGSMRPDFRWIGEEPRTRGEPAKTLGVVVGCSRLFPAVPGTRDRNRTVGRPAAVPGNGGACHRPAS